MKIILVVLAGLISSARCGDSSFSINVKNPINTISDNFISYEDDFMKILGKFRAQKSLSNLIAPAYIKLRGLSTYLSRENIEASNETEAAILLQTLK